MKSIKAMKKLQVASAAAMLVMSVGSHAAIVTASGSIVAAETVFPVAVPGATTNVRAGSFTYQYEGAVTAAASRENFVIVTQVQGVGVWAVGGAPDLVPAMILSPNLAYTTLATATVGGVRGRIALLDSEAKVPNNSFGLVLRKVVAGNDIVNTRLAGGSSLTWYFELVNNTGSAVDLQQLSVQFATQKIGTATVAGAADVSTAEVPDVAGIYPAIENLNTLSVDTNNSTAAGCVAVPTGSIAIAAESGINADGIRRSAEEDLNNNGDSRTRVANYMLFKRVLSLALSPSVNRLIQTTNSFPTNLGATPVNGIGGTGGGRYTFKPLVNTVLPNHAAGTDGFIEVAPTFTSGNATLNTTGTFPIRTTPVGERAAVLGTLTFGDHPNRAGLNALDRQLDVDPYTFAAEVGAGALGTRAAASNLSSGAGRNGDFSTPGYGNVFAGVDVRSPLSALELRFKSKPNFSGFAGQITLSKTIGTCSFPIGGAPLTQTGTLVESPVGSGNYIWSFSHAQLAAAAPDGTLRGAWTICYAVDGNTSIPATYFREVTATLYKDDATEQSNVSCQSNLAEIYGGVKVDVRNWLVSVPGDDTWAGVTRIINNSEEDTATVEGQFIHPDSGAYGNWGVIAGGANQADATAMGALVPALKPRAVAYLYNSAIAGVLTKGSSAAGADPSNVLAAASKGPGRLRVSADVSTIRVQSYIYNSKNNAFTEASASQGADFVNVESSNRDHIDQDAQTDIIK